MKAWKSGAWTLSGQAVHVLVTFAILAALGRLLSPEEFGLFGLVMAAQAFVRPILDMGLLPVYLKLDKTDEEVSNAFFTVNFLIGVLMALLFIALAPAASWLYKADQLGALMTLFSISIIFTALSGQPQAVLGRAKRFDRIVMVQTAVVCLGGALAVSLAWLGFGIWALVWRAVFESVLRFFLFAVFSRQMFRLVKPRALYLYGKEIRFGLQIVLSRILSGWVNAVDKLILGKVGLLSELGGYTRCQQLAQMPDGNIRTALTTPALSYLAGKKQETKLDDYLLLNWIVFLLAGSPCLFLMAYGHKILPFLMGAQWVSMGWMLQWAGLYGLARVFQGLMTIYHIDREKVSRTSRYIIGYIIPGVAFPLVVFLGTHSVRNYIIGLSLFSLFYWFAVLSHTMLRDWRMDKGKIIKSNLMLTLVMLLSIFILSTLYRFMDYGPDLVILGAGACASVFVNFFLLVLLDPRLARRFFSMFSGGK